MRPPSHLGPIELSDALKSGHTVKCVEGDLENEQFRLVGARLYQLTGGKWIPSQLDMRDLHRLWLSCPTSFEMV